MTTRATHTEGESILTQTLNDISDDLERTQDKLTAVTAQRDALLSAARAITRYESVDTFGRGLCLVCAAYPPKHDKQCPMPALIAAIAEATGGQA